MSPRTLFVPLLSVLLGVMAFLAPFVLPAPAQSADAQAGVGGAPLLLVAIVVACLATLLLDAQRILQRTTVITLLGMLVACNAALRFLETAIPGPGGFSPVFLLIILGGYCFGAQFGLLLGALTLLVSAVITGGVGPWLPYQMIVAGWVGLAAAACRPLVVRLGGGARAELAVLCSYGVLWGFLYGAIMNLWFWPYQLGAPEQSWQAGAAPGVVLANYARFYLSSSFVWDLFGALGNLLLLLTFGAPLLRVLRRFARRLSVVDTLSSAS